MSRWPDSFQVAATTWSGFLTRAVDRNPQQELVFPNERARLAEVEDRAYTLAGRLIEAGVRPGDSVGILLPPTLDYVVGLFAAGLAGGVCVPISSRYKTSELAYAIPRADVRVLVTSAADGPFGNFARLVAASLPSLSSAGEGDLALPEAPALKRVLLLGGAADLPALTSVERITPVPRRDVVERAARVRVSDPALILFTSGTSASPKGCVISGESLSRQAQALTEVFLDVGPDDCVTTPLPLFHIAGIAIFCTALTGGAKFCHSAHLDPADAAAQLSRERTTIWQPAFDTIFAPIIDRPEFDQRLVPDLRLMIVAGAPGLLRRVQERLPWVTVMANYGGTECVSSVTMTLPSDPVHVRTDSSGRTLPGIEVRVVDPDTGLVVPPGGRGEVQVRGPQIFSGYYRDEAANAVALADGWFHTGDLGRIDADGVFSFEGRLKDMMKVGGENVAGVEVETFLVRHPAVRIVAVVAAPDEKYGEVPAAYVELMPGATLTEDELIAFCKGEIASYKVPRHVRFVTEWPMSGTKIKKYVLRERIAQELAASGQPAAVR